jgi:hypothetical protein
MYDGPSRQPGLCHTPSSPACKGRGSTRQLLPFGGVRARPPQMTPPGAVGRGPRRPGDSRRVWSSRRTASPSSPRSSTAWSVSGRESATARTTGAGSGWVRRHLAAHRPPARPAVREEWKSGARPAPGGRGRARASGRRRIGRTQRRVDRRRQHCPHGDVRALPDRRRVRVDLRHAARPCRTCSG